MASNELMITNGPTLNGPDTLGSDGRSRDGDAWRSESICRKHPTRWWFGGDQRETAVARGICATCGVQSACLEFAIGRPEMLGIWAATTPADRAAIRRARSAPPVETAPAAPAAPVESVGTAEVAVETRVAEAAVADVAPSLQVAADELPVSTGDLALDLGAVLDLEAEHARDTTYVSATEVVSAGRSARGPGRGSGRRTPAPELDELLTPAEAARKLGVTPNTVTRWSRAGRISAIQTIGGHRRFRRCEIERVLREANLTGPVSL